MPSEKIFPKPAEKGIITLNKKCMYMILRGEVRIEECPNAGPDSDDEDHVTDPKRTKMT